MGYTPNTTSNRSLPFLTLKCHYYIWVILKAHYGGWTNRRSVRFLLCRTFWGVVFERALQTQVKYWMTFNEINNQRNWRAPLFVLLFRRGVHRHENPEETHVSGLTSSVYVASALAVKA